MKFIHELFVALQPALPFLVSIVSMYAMSGLKKASAKISSLTDVQKRVAVVIISAVLTALGKSLGLDTPTDLDLLTVGSISQIITAALASMGLYQVTKPKATTTA